MSQVTDAVDRRWILQAQFQILCLMYIHETIAFVFCAYARFRRNVLEILSIWQRNRRNSNRGTCRHKPDCRVLRILLANTLVQLDGKRFQKFCKENKLLHRKKFNNNAADLVFTSVKNKGAKVITFRQFKEKALPQVGPRTRLIALALAATHHTPD